MAAADQILHVQDFYQRIEDIVDSPLQVPEAFASATDSDPVVQRHAALFEKLQSFFDVLEAGYDQFLDQQYNIDYCTSRLVGSAFCRDHREEAATCIVDLAARTKSLTGMLVSYDVILAYGALYPAIFRSLQGGVGGSARDKITKLVHQIWAGHYAATAEATLSRLAPQQHQLGASGHEGDFLGGPGWGGASFDPSEGSQETDTGNPVAARMLQRLPGVSSANASSSYPNGSDAARTRLHQIRLRDKAVRMLYEISRVQKLEAADMRAVDLNFVSHLFDLVEDTRHHEDEGFNYQLIKLIAALNEQFMVSTISQPPSSAELPASSLKPSTNLVMGILRSRLHVTKTFGENLIFMLNRASSHSAEDVCMQLLVLKLLYLLFTTQETAHYFYTNDLKVLVDVFIRELTDLPEDSESLRHTYLRVLHPLLINTQLCSHAYKRPQIRRLLRAMVTDSLYRGEVSPTTRRLVQRCLGAEWCVELDRLDGEMTSNSSLGHAATRATSGPLHSFAMQTVGGDETTSPHPVTTDITLEGMPMATAPAALTSHPEISSLKATQTRGGPINCKPSPSKNTAANLDLGESAVAASVGGFATHALLDAPRFRSMSARSAPTTPPPPFGDTNGSAELIPLETEAEDEAAMALADGKSTLDHESSPSWQSQIASEQIDSPKPGTQSAIVKPSSSNALATQQRPIARRSSLDAFDRASKKTASRRPPPPAPAYGARQAGMPRNLWSSSSTNVGVSDPTGHDQLSTLQYLSNQAEGSIVQTEEDTSAGQPIKVVRTPSVSAGVQRAETPSGYSPDVDDERLTRSLGNIALGESTEQRTKQHSGTSSPAEQESVLSGGGKLRRRPPAPPMSASISSANSQSVDHRDASARLTNSPESANRRRGSFAGTASPEASSQRRAMLTTHSELQLRHPDVVDNDSRAGTPSSSSSARRRPPPPPVNRATKVSR